MFKKVAFPLQLKTENISNDENEEKKISFWNAERKRYALIRVMCWTLVVEAQKKTCIKLRIKLKFLRFFFTTNSFENIAKEWVNAVFCLKFCFAGMQYFLWFIFNLMFDSWSYENFKLTINITEIVFNIILWYLFVSCF